MNKACSHLVDDVDDGGGGDPLPGVDTPVQVHGRLDPPLQGTTQLTTQTRSF